MLTADYLTKLSKSFFDFKHYLLKTVDILCKAEGLTAMQTIMLFMLWSEGSVSVGELGGLINMTQSNASALCKKLEKDGLVERRRSRSDERTVLISLSSGGEQAILRMLERGKGIAEALEDIPQERLDTIIETLDDTTKMLEKINKNR